MGLDVYAVTKYNIVENPTVDEADDLCQIYQPEGFESHLCGLIDGSHFDMVECDGDYSIGYGGHSQFREFLAEIAGYKKAETIMPDYSDDDFMNKSYAHRFPHITGMYEQDVEFTDDFVAIIHFSDCEGVIGNDYCKTLDDAFDKHMSKASGSNFEKKYKEMAECVKAAANSGGFLYFH